MVAMHHHVRQDSPHLAFPLMWMQLSVTMQHQLSAHRHGKQQTDSLTHFVTCKASKTWKPSTAKHVTFMLSYLRTCLRLHSFSHPHVSRGVVSSRIMSPELPSSLDSIPSTQCKNLSTVLVSDSMAAFLQLHPSAHMGRCQEQQAGGLFLMSTLAWTAWPPCMPQ